MKLLIKQATWPRHSSAVSCRFLTTDPQVHAWGSLCGICDGLSGTGIVFSSSSSVFPSQYHSAAAKYLLMFDLWGWTVGLVVAHFHRDIVSPHCCSNIGYMNLFHVDCCLMNLWLEFHISYFFHFVRISFVTAGVLTHKYSNSYLVFNPFSASL